MPGKKRKLEENNENHERKTNKRKKLQYNISRIKNDFYNLMSNYRKSDYDRSIIDKTTVSDDVKSLFEMFNNYKYEQYIWHNLFDYEYSFIPTIDDHRNMLINHLFNKLKEKDENEYITCKECKRTLTLTLSNINDCITCYNNLNTSQYEDDGVYQMLYLRNGVDKLLEKNDKLLCLYLGT